MLQHGTMVLIVRLQKKMMEATVNRTRASRHGTAVFKILLIKRGGGEGYSGSGGPGSPSGRGVIGDFLWHALRLQPWYQ